MQTIAWQPFTVIDNPIDSLHPQPDSRLHVLHDDDVSAKVFPGKYFPRCFRHFLFACKSTSTGLKRGRFHAKLNVTPKWRPIEH